MSLRRILSAIVVMTTILAGGRAHAAPPIEGTPVIDRPENLLAWPVERGVKDPSLGEPTANLLNDLHGEVADCEMSFTTAGNYHMALRELWPVFLAKFPAEDPLRAWFYTTSPPIVRRQIENGVVQVGNVDMRCPPQVAAAPQGVMNNLRRAGLILGEPIPVIRNRGNVILVKKGNPKQVRSIWDLARPDIQVVTPNPSSELGSFTNYSNSIYDIAAKDAHPPGGMDADRLFNAIFNANKDKDDARKAKWLAGGRIHHREVPWSIAYGHGDAAVIFYHLALNAVRQFPELFEIVPLGGTAEDPDPVDGNPRELTFIVRLKNIRREWTPRQQEATENLIEAYLSNDFTAILEQHGLTRP